ncbi:hypothetical protein CLIB1444_05S05930 [[Candida] jaroonii]|uniref:Uncharacterized protein n=1 Tax=[Candida] jaroonii TaxID=467808 RepID=A0ACA9Y856_9ASCO|nr:hypothetical protein CLIB1444_05S05930 [[Candida] jaroonii]
MIPRVLPSIPSISELGVIMEDTEMVSETFLKNEHIYNCFNVYDELKVIVDKSYSHQSFLDRLTHDIYELSLILSTTVITQTLSELSSVKSVIITDEVTGGCFIDCTRKTFGNWRITIKGSNEEILFLGHMFMINQLDQSDYITIEVTKSKYVKLCEMKILRWEDITLIPTGYIGYLVNVLITKENIYSLIREIMIINSDLKVYKPQRTTILQSIDDLNLPRTNPLKLIQPEVSITKLITLTKAQVGYLIGKQGERINSIRYKTGCKVTVLPVSSDNLLTGNRRTPQVIKLFGTSDKVDNAYKLIMGNLQVYKDNGSIYS